MFTSSLANEDFLIIFSAIDLDVSREQHHGEDRFRRERRRLEVFFASSTTGIVDQEAADVLEAGDVLWTVVVVGLGRGRGPGAERFEDGGEHVAVDAAVLLGGALPEVPELGGAGVVDGVDLLGVREAQELAEEPAAEGGG